MGNEANCPGPWAAIHLEMGYEPRMPTKDGRHSSSDGKRAGSYDGKRPRAALVPVLFSTLEAGPNLFFRVVDANPGRTLDRLPRLEVFVDAEKVLDLEQQVLANVVDVSNVVSADIRRRNADDLVVTAGLIPHPEHGNGSTGDQAPGKRRLRHEHQGVERIAVLTEGSLDEAVVGGILRRGEERPVQPDPSSVVVDLILVLLALRDLDCDIERHAAQRVSFLLGVGCGHVTSLG